MTDRYDLDKPWTLDGDWYLSPSDKTGVPGELQYQPGETLRLELKGALGDPNAIRHARSYTRVLGSVRGVGACTLLNVFENNMSFGGATRSSLVAGQAILGAELPTARSARFNKSTSMLGNMEEWLGWSPIKTGNDLNTLTYEKPEELVAPIPKLRATASVESIALLNVGRRRSGFTTAAQFSVIPDTRRQHPLSWHLDVHSGMRDLLTLFTNEASWFRAIHLSKRKSDSFSYVGTRTVRTNEVHRAWISLPWSLTEVAFQDLLVSWFEHRGKYVSAHHLLFGSYYETMPYSEFGFLAVAQAVEAYVKAPLSRRKAEAKKLRHCLNDVMDKFGPAVRRSLFKPSSNFVQRVLDTRNYFTHYSKHLKARAYQGADLYYARRRLQLILRLAFLVDLGVSEPVLRETLKRYPIRENLKHWRG